MDIQTIFENGKANTIQFDVSDLLKNKLSEIILEEIDNRNRSISNELRKIANVKLKSDILELKKFAAINRDILGSDLHDELLSEIKEINEDYKWIASKNGKLILSIEKWIKKTRRLVSQNFPNEKYIYIGRSNWDPQKIIIGLCVIDRMQRAKIKEYILDLMPPSKVEFPINDQVIESIFLE